MSALGLQSMSSIWPKRLASCSRRSRGSVVMRSSASETSRGGHRCVRRERYVLRALARVPLFTEERGAQRRERDLELGIVRLDRRDLLNEEARHEQGAQWAGRAVPREEALDLERHRREERQRRKLHQQEERVVEQLRARERRRKERAEDRAEDREEEHRDDDDHDEERRAAARVERRLRARVLHVE